MLFFVACMTQKLYSFLYFHLGVQDGDLSVLSQTMAQCCKNIKETVQMLASRHKDIHGSVSKVGKAIDRVRTKTNLSNIFLLQCVDYHCLVKI